MSKHLSEAEAPASADISPAAGAQFSTPPVEGATRFDTPTSHIQTARCILELASEWTRNGLKKKDGSVVLTRENVRDIENCLGLALVQLATVDHAAALAEKIAAFTPGLVAVDPAQLGLGMVPRQSAPAFAKQAGAR